MSYLFQLTKTRKRSFILNTAGAVLRWTIKVFFNFRFAFSFSKHLPFFATCYNTMSLYEVHSQRWLVGECSIASLLTARDSTVKCFESFFCRANNFNVGRHLVLLLDPGPLLLVMGNDGKLETRSRTQDSRAPNQNQNGGRTVLSCSKKKACSRETFFLGSKGAIQMSN